MGDWNTSLLTCGSDSGGRETWNGNGGTKDWKRVNVRIKNNVYTHIIMNYIHSIIYCTCTTQYKKVQESNILGGIFVDTEETFGYANNVIGSRTPVYAAKSIGDRNLWGEGGKTEPGNDVSK